MRTKFHIFLICLIVGCDGNRHFGESAIEQENKMLLCSTAKDSIFLGENVKKVLAAFGRNIYVVDECPLAGATGGNACYRADTILTIGEVRFGVFETLTFEDSLLSHASIVFKFDSMLAINSQTTLAARVFPCLSQVKLGADSVIENEFVLKYSYQGVLELEQYRSNH